MPSILVYIVVGEQYVLVENPFLNLLSALFDLSTKIWNSRVNMAYLLTETTDASDVDGGNIFKLKLLEFWFILNELRLKRKTTDIDIEIILKF